MLPSEFFDREPRLVASDLIGKVLWREGFGGGRLTEVEAYLPLEDPASHSAIGSTARSEAMFGAPGSMYVFLSYGVHHLLNFVCDKTGVGSAVLVRSFEPIEGLCPGPLWQGAKGPGIVGRALGIGLDMNGRLLGERSGVFVLDDGVRPDFGVCRRVGIVRGAELLLRYYAIGSRYVSGPARLIEER